MKTNEQTTQRNSFVTAVKWAFVMNWGQRAFGLAITLVLAALLGPEAFGVVAMALVFIAFCEMMLEQGLTAALIQRKRLRPRHLDSAFWFVMGMGVVFTGLALAGSSWWAAVNDLPALTNVVRALALLVPIQCLTVVQQAILQREMRFRTLAIRANCAVVCGGVGGLVLAFAGAGVWALVGQKLFEAVAGLIVLWSVANWKPRRRFSWARLGQLFGFSMGTFATRVGTFAAKRIDVILIGLFFGPVAVGLYRLADRLVSTCLEVATGSLSVVALPQYSSVQDDRPAFRASLLWSLRASASLTIPGLAVLAAMAAPLTRVLGEEWILATDVLRVLAISGIVYSISFLVTAVLQAAGRPYLMTVVTWIVAACYAAAIIAAGLMLGEADLKKQVVGVAWAHTLVGVLISFPVCVWLMMRFTGMHLFQMIGAVAFAFLAGGVGFGVACGAAYVSDGIGIGVWGDVILRGTTGLGASAIVLLAFDSELRALLRHLRQDRNAKLQRSETNSSDVLTRSSGA